MKRIFILSLCVALSMSSFAQINTNDPTLRLWLKGDSLTGSTLLQRNTNSLTVPIWTDSSTNGTVLGLGPLPTLDTGNDPSNHVPQLLVVTNNGRVFQSVGFSQSNDPVAPPQPGGHLADRLIQTNNLDANDPTLIDAASDITLITVVRNTAVALGSYPCIIAKRGSGASPYELAINAAAPDYAFITYAGSTVYHAGSPSFPVPTAEYGIVEMNVTAGGTLTFREYYRSFGGWQVFSTTGVARGGFAVGEPFTLACHTQGGTLPNNPFDGGGAYERFAGDIAEVALYNRTLSSNELQSVETYLLTKYFLNPGLPVITTQPQSKTVAVFSPVSFSVLADGTPPFSYQWLKGGVPIPGAPDSPSYTIASAVATNSGAYSVKVSNDLGFTNSFDAILTVVSPTNKPALLTALRGYNDATAVTVTFSEPVSVSTATNFANYSINNGVTINGATAATNTNYVTSVVLSASPITIAPSILTATNLVDLYGNTSAPNSQVTIPIPGAVSPPPDANRLVWLAADTNVLADVIGVYEWDDQSDPSLTHAAFAGFGNVKVGQVASPNAIHPFLSFDGSSGLSVAGSAAFNLQSFTIYLVGDLDTSKAADRFIANWEGFVLGGSDGPAASVQFSTWGGGYNQINSPVVGNRVPTLIAASFANPGEQRLALNTVQVGVLSNTVPIDYTNARGLAIGALFPTPTQNLFGDIAEILIYANVSAAQDAAVQDYLIKKYFAPSATPPKLVSATASIAQPATSVTVVFSDAVTPATAANSTHYTIDHGVTVSSATVVNGTTVSLTTSALDPGTTYTLSASGVTDWAGNAPNNQVTITLPSCVVRLQDSSANHLLVLEAEHYSLNTPGGGQSWAFTTSPPFLLPAAADTTFSGSGCMVVLPNTGNSYSFNPGNLPVGVPQLDFRVYFTTAGTNYIWVRGSGDSDTSGANDSISLGLDGVLAYRINGVFPQSAGYAWGSTPTPAGAVFTNATPGYHVINAWMREDGFGFDKLVLSSNPAFNPSGIGPAESAAILLPITVTKSGGGLTLSWVCAGILQSANNPAGPYSDVVGASSPWPVSPTGVQKYYRLRE